MFVDGGGVLGGGPGRGDPAEFLGFSDNGGGGGGFWGGSRGLAARGGGGGGGLPHPGQDQRAEQPAGVLPEHPLGDADQQHSTVEDFVHVEAGARVTHRAFYEVAEQERAEPGQDGADDLGAQGGGHLVVP